MQKHNNSLSFLHNSEYTTKNLTMCNVHLHFGDINSYSSAVIIIDKQKMKLTIHSQNNDIHAVIPKGCRCLSITPFLAIQQSDK